MAPFSRFSLFAFSVGSPKNFPIKQHSLHRNELFQGSKGLTSNPQYSQYSKTRIASLATPPSSELALDGDWLSWKLEDESLPVPQAITQRMNLSHLSKLLGASPSDLLSLDADDHGVRGVYLNKDVSKNDDILKIPLSSCLRDDTPPSWFLDIHDEADSPALQPGAWATRLAASLIEQQTTTTSKGMSLWLSLLPEASFLRASLPIHWSEDLLENAKCTALELAIDSAYFSRAEALADLKMALDGEKERMEYALDLVQTRACRVERKDGTAVRLLAPIFDFINHASTPNAEFALENDTLVVRATTDLQQGQQVLIDYGDSARPQWKCLASYGFMPDYTHSEEEQNVAEVYVHGRRFEVGPSTIPVDLVEAVESQDFYERLEVQEAPETVLTPDIAMRIANRVSEVAFQLLLNSNFEEEELAQLYEDALDQDDKLEENQQSPQDIISARLAASLRFAQHRTLLACANNLIDWAVGERGDASSENE